MKKKIIYFLFLKAFFAFSQIKETAIISDSLIGNNNSDLFNGLVYTNKYTRTLNNTSQFLDSNYMDGTVFYDNNLYEKVKLKYDVVSSSVLVKTNLNLEFHLINDKIEYFSIGKRKFKKYVEKVNNLTSETRFYEEIEFNPNNFLYIKHTKTIKENLESGIVKYLFYDDKFYFFSNSNQIFPITNKKSVIEIFPEKKKQIQEFYYENEKLKNIDLNLFYQKLFKEII